MLDCNQPGVLERMQDPHPPLECDSTSALGYVAPYLARLLSSDELPAPLWNDSHVRVDSAWVPMRDGIRLATDIYLPPLAQAPTIVVRTPYGRRSEPWCTLSRVFAQRGYAVVVQDCRGTGESEPESWDYYIHESEDSFDCVQWLSQRSWFSGFIGGCGGSYVGQTQWGMSTHPLMTTIVPEVSGLGIARNTAHLHMFCNAYARSVGKGRDKHPISYKDLEREMLPETLAGGYYNQPLHTEFTDAVLARNPTLASMNLPEIQQFLWQEYCRMPAAERATFVREALGADKVTIIEIEALSEIFGNAIAHDAHSLPFEDVSAALRALHATPLVCTGWYDWALNDALATWAALRRAESTSLRDFSRLVIAPSAHNMPGYHEGADECPALRHNHRVQNRPGLLLHWYDQVRRGTLNDWPRVIYFLMGANEWRTADEWPPPNAQTVALHLRSNRRLHAEPDGVDDADTYRYDPTNPTPTVGGSILSNVYRPGSCDVSEVQKRSDVLTYTTPPLARDVDVAGPLRMVLYASSTAADTDFVVRLTDVFPDERAIQLQSGILRARYRDPGETPRPLLPGQVYRLEIDMWATANRFAAGHRIRIDVSSADFPRFDRNANRAGSPGAPIPATQRIFRGDGYPSHLLLPVLNPPVRFVAT